MTNLTEQYIKGNLQEGDEYYIKNKDGEVFTMYLYNDTVHWHSFKVKKQKVLAPVPSYKEFNILKKFMVSGINATNRIHKLERLLKECKEYFDNMSPDFDSHDFDEIISKIDQALANNKIKANTVACNKIQESE